MSSDKITWLSEVVETTERCRRKLILEVSLSYQ